MLGHPSKDDGAIVDQPTLESAVAVLSACDPVLALIARDHGVPPLWARKPGFATLVRIILEQQVSLLSARAVYRKLSLALGRVTPWTVLAASADDLRGIGLTRQKTRYCRALADAVLNGGLNLAALQTMSAQQVEESLTRVTGIGRWTSDIYRLMALRHVDVWPRGDLALYKAMRETLATDLDPASLDARAMEWQPWRSVAARLLWLYYLRTR